MARVFSGIQPSGNLTLGNYAGSLSKFVKMQHEHECVFCIVDLHALTIPKDPDELREATIKTATLFVASGLDPNKCTIFLQSHVKEHSELAWLLSCQTYFGELSRMTQFKDKSEKAEMVTAGLFTYPVLMAADILLYDTELVPVGEDQKQHVELTRDIAERLNNRYGEIVKVPQPVIGKVGARIMALKDPTRKMSKSDPVPANYIALVDEPNVIKKKIMRAVTDSDNEVRYDKENKPGISNLLEIHSVCSGESIAELEQKYAGKGYGEFKRGVADAVITALEPIQKRYHELRKSGEIMDILHEGAKRAQPIAAQVLARVQEAIGLVKYRVG